MSIVRKVKKAIGLIQAVKVKEEDAELLIRIRKAIQLDDDATSEQRQLELDDLRFCDPMTQWSDEDRRSREDAGRPCLTEDRLGPFLMQVCNEQRKNKPGVQVNPVDSGADIETAEVIQGLIRHIEYNSNADTAYDTAFEWAVRCGRGFYRVCTDYVDDQSLDQEIQIKRIANPHMVFVDPSAVECDYSDMKWGGFKMWMSREDYEAQYPESELANAGTDAWLSVGDDAPDWMAKDGGACLVVEYFEKEFKKETIEVEGRERDVMKATVKWYKTTAVEVLERGEFASRYIPIIPVLGKELIINNKRTYAGLVRSGKDPQKRLNYLLTSQVERIAFMPLATWIGAKGFMGKNRQLWNASHKTQMAALEFEVIGDDGQGINAPRLITEEAPIMAVTNALHGSEEGLKATLGMYDASLGNREANQSGKAIERLQSQGETGNFHFQDNLSRAIRHEGRIILDLLPTVYDTERIVRTIGEDGTQKLTKINGPVNPEDTDDKQAIGKLFDLTTGRYDVTISAGPSYQSKRQEDRAMLLGMLQGPMGQLLAQRAPDLVTKTLDSPIAKALAERLTPPDVAQKEQGQQNPLPHQFQQQIQALEQQHGQLVQALHSAHDQLDSKQAELDNKMKIAEMQELTKRLDILARTNAAAAQTQLHAEIQVLEAAADRQHEIGLQQLQAQSVPEPSANPAGEQPETAGPQAGKEAL